MFMEVIDYAAYLNQVRFRKCLVRLQNEVATFVINPTSSIGLLSRISSNYLRKKFQGSNSGANFLEKIKKDFSQQH